MADVRLFTAKDAAAWEEYVRQRPDATVFHRLAWSDAVATDAFDLPCRWVIHTVGPNLHRGQDDPQQLASCFTRSLNVARDLGARTVAFPAISGGAYGWAMDDVARIAVDAVRSWPGGTVKVVRFVLASRAALDVFTAALEA